VAADITRAELASLGLRAAALASISDADQDAEIVTSTSICRAYLRARYQGAGLTAAVLDPGYKGALAKVATYRLLSTRGFSPAAGSDQVLLDNHNASLRFLRDVSDGRAHLDVEESQSDSFAASLPSDGILSDEPRGW